ncbi:MAG: response regulator transcription factor [Erysipelotrichaceae bacterium]
MRNVLIVDDEEIVRLGLMKLIDWEAYGYEVVMTCVNGKDALTFIQNYDQPIHVLLTDLKMPLMSGIELLEAIQSHRFEIDVKLVLSAHDGFDMVREAFLVGADDYILKSVYEEKDIIQAISRIYSTKNKGNSLLTPVEWIQEYVKSHYQEDLSLTKVAQAIGYSETYVSHLFSRECNETLVEYICRIRIERAAHLLRETDLKVYEVADRVGFLSVEHFSRSFKKLTGQSPSQYE